MGVLALKLFLAPSFVVAASVVARHHGSRIGGLVGGLPVVGGPILIVLAVVHGRAFGAEASTACVLGMVSLVLFVIVYGRLAEHVHWAAALVVGWLAFGASTAVLAVATDRPGPLAGLAAAFVACGLGFVLLPRASVADTDAVHPTWDLPMRAGTAAAMVVALTALSSSLGSELSGLLAPFPIITSVLAAFTHAQRGAGETVVLLRGMLGGFFVYATLVFLFALALGAHV
ncbi:MAG: hypothetical protein QOC55_1881 [Thermoleophilaceae bacterium]|nr:hypothetical protein [Thermoleophilaceae bacterium]